MSFEIPLAVLIGAPILIGIVIMVISADRHDNALMEKHREEYDALIEKHQEEEKQREIDFRQQLEDEAEVSLRTGRIRYLESDGSTPCCEKCGHEVRQKGSLHSFGVGLDDPALKYWWLCRCKWSGCEYHFIATPRDDHLIARNKYNAK